MDFTKYANEITGSEREDIFCNGDLLFKKEYPDFEEIEYTIMPHVSIYYYRGKVYVETADINDDISHVYNLSVAHKEAYKEDYGPYAQSAMDGSLNKTLDDCSELFKKINKGV